MPYAARLQGDVRPLDHELTRIARTRRPSVAWWWGIRDVAGPRYAFCYVCDASLIQTTAGTAISDTARDVILLHRSIHHDGRDIPSGSDAPGTIPGADTHGEGGRT